MSERSPFKVYRKPKFQSSSLVVGWGEDAGQLGPGVIDYLTQRLGGEKFGEIEPEDFFHRIVFRLFLPQGYDKLAVIIDQGSKDSNKIRNARVCTHVFGELY